MAIGSTVSTRRSRNAARAAAALIASRSRRASAPPTCDRTSGQTGDDRPRAGHLAQERHDAVAVGDRAVEVERGDPRHARAHARRAGIDSSTSQNAGQLFDTTSGSATSMPSTTRPSRPNAIASRWSWWVSRRAPCSRSVGRMQQPVGPRPARRRRSCAARRRGRRAGRSPCRG